MASDAYTDERLAARQWDVSPPSDADVALVREVRTRLEECRHARQHWLRQRDSDREFLESQFTEAQRAYRLRTDRPAVEIHLLHARLEQILNDWREADMGFRVRSATSSGGEDAARIFNGIAQRDLRASGAAAIMQRIVEDSITLGEGWGRWAVVDADRDEVAEKLWDGQDWSLTAAIGVEDRDLRMKYCAPEEVWPDPHAVEPDRRDMDWLIETRWLTLEERDRMFPNARKLEPVTFESMERADREWFQGVGDGLERDKMVRIAYYWRRRYEAMDYVFLPEWPEAKRADRLSAEEQAAVDAAPLSVTVQRKRVRILELAVVDGKNVLYKPVAQPVSRIPYFRSVGTEVRYSTGELVPRGLVSVMRGLSFWMSVTASDVAWKQATVGLDFWEVTEDAIAGYDEQWQNMATPSTIRVVNQWERNPAPGQEAKEIRAPQYKAATPNLADNMQVLGVARDLAGMVGGAADAQSRSDRAANQSAIAVGELDRMGRNNRTRWIFNAHAIMLQAAGDIHLDWSRPTYGRTGRLIEVGSETPGDPDEGVLVGVPFVRHPDTGEPLPMPQVPDGVKVLPLPAPEGTPPVTVKVHRFYPSTDRVKVETFSSGMMARTRDAKAEYLMQLAQGNQPGPERAVLVKSALRAVSDVVPMDDVIRQLDAVTPDPVAEQDTDVSTLMGRLAQMTQQNQQLQQQLEQATAAADQTSAAKEIEQMKAEQRAMTAELIANIKGEFAVAVAEIRAESQTESAEIEAGGRVEQAMVETAVRSDDQDRKMQAEAAIAGLKEGARGAERRNDDDRD